MDDIFPGAESVRPPEEVVEQALLSTEAAELPPGKRAALLNALKQLQAIILGFGTASSTVFNNLSGGSNNEKKSWHDDREYNRQWSPGKVVAGSPIVPINPQMASSGSGASGGSGSGSSSGKPRSQQQLQSPSQLNRQQELLVQLSQSTTKTTEELLQDLIDRDMARAAQEQQN